MSPRKKDTPAPEGHSATPMEKAAADVPAEGREAAEGSPVGASDIERIVVFFVDGQRYGLPVDRIQEIHHFVAVRSVPDPAEAVVGMVDLRGTVIPVLDARLLLGLPFQLYDLQTPMIICRAHGGFVALVVDAVEDVLDVDADTIQPPSRIHALASRALGVIRAMDDLVIVLDVDATIPAESASLAARPKKPRRAKSKEAS